MCIDIFTALRMEMVRHYKHFLKFKKTQPGLKLTKQLYNATEQSGFSPQQSTRKSATKIRPMNHHFTHTFTTKKLLQGMQRLATKLKAIFFLAFYHIMRVCIEQTDCQSFLVPHKCLSSATVFHSFKDNSHISRIIPISASYRYNCIYI